MADSSPLQQLAAESGIALGFNDNWNNYHQASDQELAALLAAIGVDFDEESSSSPTLNSINSEHVLRRHKALEVGIEPVTVVEVTSTPGAAVPIEISVELCVTSDSAEGLWKWQLSVESGEAASGACLIKSASSIDPGADGVAYHRLQLGLALDVDCGYYDLQLHSSDIAFSTTLIVVPEKSFVTPDAIKMVGVSTQLYSLSSETSQGIGDFADLEKLCGIAAESGVDAVGLNPLHVLYRQHPVRCSPYSPSSRLFFNPVYIELASVPGYEALDEALLPRALRDASGTDGLINYGAVVQAKLDILHQLHLNFCADSEQFQAEKERYRHFVDSHSDALALQARFEAFDKWFSQSQGLMTWHHWPAEYQQPDSAEVTLLARQLENEIDFSCFLQWLCHEQLTAVAQYCKDVGMSVGLYLDLAVGVDVNGAERWANPQLFANKVHIGAPPDALGPLGQDWSLSPYRPSALRESAYQPFIDMLRANMRYAGALRIDHVMGLMRQYWCVPELTQQYGSAKGAYMSFPFEDLLGILALESHRNQCMLIGEDLGTVPAGVREQLDRRGILRYRVLYFEKEHDAYRHPHSYPEQALAAATTHDLPTLAGFWLSHDIQMRQQLGLFETPEQLQQQQDRRIADKRELLKLLEKQGLIRAGLTAEFEHNLAAEAQDILPVADFVDAVHRLLGGSPSRLLMIQLEDLLCQSDMVNLPGTIDEHPNWRRTLALQLEGLGEHIKSQTSLRDIVSARNGSDC